MEKKNKNEKENTWKIVAICMTVVIVFLIILVMFLIDHLEERYDDKEENVPNVVDKSDNVDSSLNDNKDNTTEEESNNKTETTNNYIGKEKALDIVLDHAKVEQKNIYDLDIELEYKYGSNVYEIDFNYNHYDYEYYVDAKSGEILHSFKEFDY